LRELEFAVSNQGNRAGTCLAPRHLNARRVSHKDLTVSLNARGLGENRALPIEDRRRSRERAVSIFSRAKALSVSWPAAYLLAASTLTIVTWNTAAADMVGVGGCVGGRGSFNCVGRIGTGGDPYVRTVPQSENAEQKEQAAARDRKWIERCHPSIAQDRYGVPRYRYGAAGCEFGVIE
jgi:hypothetical protein